MSVLVILELSIQPDKVDEYLAQFPSILPDTRAFTGCEEITVHQSEDDPTDVVLLERWATKEAQQKYVAWRQERGDIARLSEPLASPPKTRYFVDLDL